MGARAQGRQKWRRARWRASSRRPSVHLCAAQMTPNGDVDVGEQMLVGDDDKDLYRLGMDGKTTWKKSHADSIKSEVVESKGVVYYVATDRLIAAAASNGDRKWERFVGKDWKTKPVLVGAYVAVAEGKNMHFYYQHNGAPDAGNGGRTHKYDTAGGNIKSAPAVKGNIVYFGCDDAHVYAVEAKTNGQKKMKWKKNVGKGEIQTDVVLDSDHLYVPRPAVLPGVQATRGRPRTPTPRWVCRVCGARSSPCPATRVRTAAFS